MMNGIASIVIALTVLCCSSAMAANGEGGTDMTSNSARIVLDNRYARYVIGPDGKNESFIDKRSSKNYCSGEPPSQFAVIKKSGASIPCTSAVREGDKIILRFADSGVEAAVKPIVKDDYIGLEVLSLTGDGVERLDLINVTLTQEAEGQDDFSACVLALNLQTNVHEIPGPNTTLRAMCYSRFGFAGAKAAIVASAYFDMRSTLQKVVSSALETPYSPIGGPFALDAEINRGSYLFNFGNLSEQTVDEWIDVAKSLGMNQIDFHGGSSFRFGDCRPNPQTYPNGRASLKAVIDKLHAAGIKAGLHTYAFFIDKTCPWVTPVPDPRLGWGAAFTLAEAISPEADIVPVVESTEKMSTVTGFFERNSVTLRVDDELIVYSGISKQPPYSFTGCQRGAHGTKISAHDKGAKVYHLKECFGLFAPDGDSTLLAEVAAKTAEVFNECGFDMMYLDALDGSDILGGPENHWHYGSKFVFELVKRLDRPALMEMSTFHHHLWYVRSRIGAMDYPTRSQKQFIDIHCRGHEKVVHCAGNRAAERMFLPAEMGWWAVHTAEHDLLQTERTFPDDIEYLMCKGMSTDTGFALMGINPDTIKSIPAFQQLAPIFKNYEDLRHKHYFSQATLDRLKEPQSEFTLEQAGEDDWVLRPVKYDRHKVTGADNTWNLRNDFSEQPLKIRIEALLSSAPFDSPEAKTLVDWTDSTVFGQRESAEGITAKLETDTTITKYGNTSGKLSAENKLSTRDGSWCKVESVFSPPLDLSANQALGVWVHGDGKGEILNLQLKSPRHLAWGIGDHYIRVDFTGWRYFELLEPEGGRIHDYTWPYGSDIYGIYREKVNYSQVETLGLWYNNLPTGDGVTCYIGPIRALPAIKTKLINPSVTIDGKTITFPIELESGHYLEMHSLTDCKVYGLKGELITTVTPQGELPVLAQGDNQIALNCRTPDGTTPRAWVTVITKSDEVLR